MITVWLLFMVVLYNTPPNTIQVQEIASFSDEAECIQARKQILTALAGGAGGVKEATRPLPPGLDGVCIKKTLPSKQ